MGVTPTAYTKATPTGKRAWKLPPMLTDTACKKAKPMGARMRLYDTGGMYLEIAPAGGKWWRLKYRIAKKEKLLSLGTYPEITLAEAREKRDEARKLLRDGIDPSAHRKALRASRATAGQTPSKPSPRSG